MLPELGLDMFGASRIQENFLSTWAPPQTTLRELAALL